ncbi:MAG TPA: Uma2 family endonuclease [Opitutaceae bacterium]
MESAAHSHLSADNYLTSEQAGEVRHEYIGGVVYAMAGASEEHGLISGNLYVALRQHLGAGPCKTFIADMKVRLEIARDDIFYYPDVLVTCDPADTHRFYKTRPVFIAEVLSPETERYDRREKFLSYIRLPSLNEYLLISQSEPLATLFRRDRAWEPEHLHPGQELILPSLDFRMPVAALFAGVSLPSTG